MPRLIDLTGKVYGRLSVLYRATATGDKPRWFCECECGVQKSILGSDLRGGLVQSCGCLRNERVRAVATTHGDASRARKRPEYNVWLAMRSRCHNPANKDFQHYGGRGIAVCDWWSSYAHFIADMGPRPSPKHTIDRIDVNGDYEPANCRWATWSEQRRNTRAYIEKHGVSHG